MRIPPPAIAALLALPLACCAHAQEPPRCASSIHELRQLAGDPAFPLRWEETSMDDGKPMRVSISEHNGALKLAFVKTDESLWAEGAGRICRSGATLEARLSKDQLRLGPAANWLARMALADGAAFTLQRRTREQLHIATQGWCGRFVPAADD
ncbi:hypothetical protein OPU71_12210 [Niveibacterium sp. 24ML]|uniref:hypothetical protein n=1 Tax=Niveibacterium sp. 24ML TaxID=2985512 RepID=UPI00226D69BF|nr:hypothetical protein [Niveibacterium sp. 24ML]MCX9156889.1 hypothetical protein [Niveibacterium sp. 24ML]